MKIVGISRVRNEGHIIKDTLDHVGNLVDEIYIYDDCSDDKTADICKVHPKVKKVIKGKSWGSTPQERNIAEGNLRQAVYDEAVRNGADWVYCFDADEFADFEGVDFKADAYSLRLFDFYITEEDKDKEYKDRVWMGPEYRDIIMLFKVNPNIKFKQRQPRGYGDVVKRGGYVKHYGKAISVDEWEKTCDYYMNNRGGDFLPEFTNKWKNRKGKAIHTLSDFNKPLIKWEDRKAKGVPLIENN